jgi:chromosome segregation ATPase
MSEEGWMMALADSWLGKGLAMVVLVIAGAFGGWWTSRANIMNAVTARVEALIGHLESEIKRLTTVHVACEVRLDEHKRRLDQVEGELRQAKQTIDSIDRVKGR